MTVDAPDTQHVRRSVYGQLEKAGGRIYAAPTTMRKSNWDVREPYEAKQTVKIFRNVRIWKYTRRSERENRKREKERRQKSRRTERPKREKGKEEGELKERNPRERRENRRREKSTGPM